jgi:hypothetical protein
LIAAEPEDTVYTDVFALGWPITAPHRVLRSSVVAAEACPDDVVGANPVNEHGERTPIHRFETMVPMAGTTGTVAAMSLWAGESVVGVKAIQPAAEIVRELAGEAERLLQRWGHEPDRSDHNGTHRH